MNKVSTGHFFFVECSKVYVFGGEMGNHEDYNIEIFDGENWENGPKFPFYLNTYNAQAGLDDKNGS